MATRIEKGASSWASSSLTPSRAHFDATYGAWAIAASRPTTLVTFTIVPDRRARIPGSTCWMQRIAPDTLTSKDASYCSIDASSTTPLPPIPALFTSTSMRPVARRTSANPRATDSELVTSSSTRSTVTFRSLHAASSFVADSSERTVPKTRYPRSARWSAVARPMPELAPVTMVTKPVSEVIGKG